MEKLTAQDLALGLREMARSKKFWLDNFGRGPKKRPENEIDTQKHHHNVLHEAANYFQAKANRNEAVED